MQTLNVSQEFLDSLSPEQQERLELDNISSFEAFVKNRQAKEREAAKAAEHLKTLLV